MSAKFREWGRDAAGTYRGERRRRDSEKSALGDDVSPAGLGLVDGLVEEVVKEEVLQLRVLAEGGSDVLQDYMMNVSLRSL